jgi:hypothetical protein
MAFITKYSRVAQIIFVIRTAISNISKWLIFISAMPCGDMLEFFILTAVLVLEDGGTHSVLNYGLELMRSGVVVLHVLRVVLVKQIVVFQEHIIVLSLLSLKMLELSFHFLNQF